MCVCGVWCVWLWLCCWCVWLCMCWCVCVVVCGWLCGWLCGCVVVVVRWSPPGSLLTLPLSSLLHHLPGANMCVAHALKITVHVHVDVHIHLHIHIDVHVHVGVTMFAHFPMKQRSLEYLLSMMSAFRNLLPFNRS